MHFANARFPGLLQSHFPDASERHLLLSNPDESSVLVAPNVGETLGGALALVAPERRNFYEAGLEQALFGRLSLNASAGYARSSEGRRRWELALPTSNLANKTALHNFQSLFVGTRLAPPRTAGPRFRWFFGEAAAKRQAKRLVLL